jgi:hypothetical protein
MPVPSPSAPANNARQRPARRPTSDWIIRRLPGTETIDYHKPFNGNAYTMIKAIEACLRQALGEATLPITILAGRWWSPLSSNFTLTLAANPAVTTVWKYRDAILKPFGPNIFNLVPNEGQTRIAFQGVPIYRHDNGSLPTTAELIKELGKNLPYKSCTLVEGPIWTKATLADATKDVGAFTILLSDPGRKLPAIIRKPAYMFGKRLTVSFTSKFTPFKQCARCHILSHTTEECRCPAEYVRCHICGIPNHTAKEHATKCANKRKHSGILCDCPIQCINCVYHGKPGKGHLAIDDSCPLKKNMRGTSPTLMTATTVTAPPPAPPTQPPRVDDA